MQIIHCKKFCVPVSIGTLNNPSDSISGSVTFQNFLGENAPKLPSVGIPMHTMTVHIPNSPTSTVKTILAVPPLFRSLDSNTKYICTVQLISKLILACVEHACLSLVPIMLLKLPIMLWSNAPEFCLLCSIMLY